MLNNRCILAQLWNGLKLSNLKSNVGPLLWGLIFVCLLAWRAQNLDAFGLSNDEGAHVMWAKLAVDGYRLYEETRAVQQPLFLGWIAGAFRLVAPSLAVGRWAILLTFVLLAVALSELARRTSGWAGALTALLLVGLSPLIFVLSRAVMAEIPATALAVTSVALLLPFMDSPRRSWLLASGLAMGASWMVKLLHPFALVPVGLLLLKNLMDTPRRGWRGFLLDGLIWGLGFITPLVVILLLYDPAALYDQLVAFRGDLRAAIPGTWPETWAQFRLFVSSHWGLWLLAGGAGVSTGWRVWSGSDDDPPGRRPLFYRFVWAAWLLAGVVMLAWHTPLFPHHFVVLLPPLILLGAVFIADGIAFWRRSRRVAAVLSGVIVIVALFNAPAMIAANQQTAAIVTGGREAQALELLRAVSAPDDFLMGDSQLLIFMADRRTPPPLGDVALVAVKAGRQTSERMVALTEAYRAPAVVQWSLRLPWLPDYLAWVEANYLARRVWDNDHIIYFVPRIPANQPLPNERHLALGDLFTLRGFEVDEDLLKAGGQLNLKVYWQATAAVPDDYTIFTQVLDRNGALVAGWDSQPLAGHFPTSRWPAGDIVTDVVQLPLPAELPPGPYRLITGLYLLETLERLPTADGQDYVTLTTAIPGLE